MAGRPLTYEPGIATQILDAVSEGRSVISICRELGVKHSTFFGWVIDNVDGIADKYARAQRLQTAAWRDATLEIADDGSNDYVEKKNRDGSTYEAFNSEHVRRSEIRIKQRNYLVEFITANLAKKDENTGNLTPAAEAIAALERIASVKAEPAQVKPYVLAGFEDE